MITHPAVERPGSHGNARSKAKASNSLEMIATVTEKS